MIICLIKIHMYPWYTNDSTDTERTKIVIWTPSLGLHQVINEATYILNNSSSCIDLIFTSQRYLVTESGVHSSLHANCHHQITYIKFNLNVIYQPPYQREVRHYKLVNSERIQCPIANYARGKSFFITLMQIKRYCFLMKQFLSSRNYYIWR